MKVLTLSLAILLLATNVLAIPHQLPPRELRRRSPPHQSHPPRNVTKVSSSFDATVTSSNWAGAVLVSPPSGTTFVAVNGTITVPEPTVPSGGSTGTAYYGSAWVGIDGYNTDSILQTGVAWGVEKERNGQTEYAYWAWYEWYPEASIELTSLTISAGDVISMAVVATTTTTGYAVITDETTGESATISFSGDALEEENAEWIVEDFAYTCGSTYCLYPFADFGTVTFTDATATLSNGTVVSVGSSNTTEIVIEETSGRTETVVTEVTLGDETVTVTYE